MSLAALFVDFDAYFASAEQHMQPYLRGKPVGVAPVMAESSCCIAASYEAKAFGIKTGTRISDARVLCPGIQIVEAQPAKYVELHHQLVKAVESCIHVEQILSIDEMWCWLPYNLREPETVEKIGRNIKKAITEQVGPWIRGSVGAAPNKWLAKMASKMRKPDGLLIICQKDLPEILYDLDLRDMHGVGRNMELRLHAHGIHDVRALCTATRQQLHTAWGGIVGDQLWFQLRGKEIPEAETTRRSIGHSHVLPPEKRHPDGALPVLHKLTQKAAQRLRSHGMLTRSFHLSLSYLRGGKWGDEIMLEATDDSLTLARAASGLWKKRPHHGEHLLKVSMVLGRLTHVGNYTPLLFPEDKEPLEKANTKIQALNTSMDKLVQKFGRQSIYLGGAHGAIEAAPMRISFGHIPDIGIEGD
jgi:DNA polymerase-4